MNTINRKTVCVIAALSIIGLTGGCGGLKGTSKRSKLAAGRTDLGTTIGSLAEIYSAEFAAVEGYGLVGGLQGTGSSECPPALRAYLRRYILTQLPQHKINVDELIDSDATAVVHVGGEVQTVMSGKRYFDVRVTALRGTQTTSLEGGWLYGAELKVAGRLGAATRAVGSAGGPVFIDKIGSPRASRKVGYVLAGGRVLKEYRAHLVLHEPDFEVTSNVRNRINERFGFGAAKAVLPGRIELGVPPNYRGQEQRFISMVKATYLSENPEITKERIMAFIRKLAISPDKYASEVALEAIGNESLGKLSILLNSSNEEVRLHAGRCMLNLGSQEGLGTLIRIAMDTGSAYRIEALEALTRSARRNDAAAISRRLLRDDDFGMRLAAYEQLRELDDISLAREFIARSFYLEQIAQSQYEGIFVSRSGEPRIVLFGAPISCRDNVFVQSEDGSVILNAPTGQNYVSVIRKHPTQPSVVAHLKSSFDLADIIRVLCEEPSRKDEEGHGGLGVSYSEMIALIKQMCDKGAVSAEFRAGPLPKIGVIVKK